MTQPMLNEYTAELEALARRQRLADLLRQQSMQPLQGAGMAGRTVAPIHWTQGAAQMLRGANAGATEQNVNRDRGALAQRYQTDRGDRLSRAIESARGGDRLGAGRELFMSPDPMSQQLGMDALSQMISPKQGVKMQDMGDSIGVFDSTGNLLGTYPKAASPDARLRETGAQQRHATPSGGDVLREGGAMQRHQTPSGSAQLQERGAMARHSAPSGSALVAERGAMARHQTPSGSAMLAADPAVQGRLAEAKAAAKEMGESQAKAQIALPGAVSKAQEASRLVDMMVGAQGDPTSKPHPGFQTAVGATIFPGLRFIEGTDTASFMALLDQVKGGAFLQAFESLKGGGAISEVEGKKGTDAITRMSKAQTEAEFITAAREFQDVLKTGIANVQRTATPQRRSTDGQAVRRYNPQTGRIE